MNRYVTTGNTYPGRAALKEAGFRWDAEEKAWTGDQAAYDRWQYITRPVYGMTYRRGLGEYQIVQQ